MVISKKSLVFLVVALVLLLMPFISAQKFLIYVVPLDDLGEVQPSKSFAYEWKFTTNEDCSGVILTKTQTVTTDLYGRAFVELDLGSFSSIPSYLCEYRNGTFRGSLPFYDQIFSNTFTKNLNASGNITAQYFIGDGSRLTGLAAATESDPYWAGNYSAYNSSWSSTYNSTYAGYNLTGLIRDWNSTGLIKNWSGNYLSSESDPLWTSNQSSYFTKSDIIALGYYNSSSFDINNYYLKSNPYGYINSTTLSSLEFDPLWTSNQSLYPRITELVGLVGNWTLDKSSYSTTAQANSLYYGIGNPYGFYNSTTFSINDYYLKSNPYGFYNATSLTSLSQLIDNLGNRGYTSLSNFTNDLGYLNASTLSASESDPHWTGNYSTYLTLFNWNKTYADGLYYGIGNPYSYLNSTTLSASESDPHWTSNKSNYYNKTQIETNFTNYYTSSQTEGAIGSANTSMKNYADAAFLRREGDNGTGVYNFGGSWTEGGITINSGSLYAQTVYVYNVTSLGVNNLNINGSLLPPTGFDNTFNIGSGALRWKNSYFSGSVYVNGSVYGNVYGAWNGSVNYYTISQIENNLTNYYTSSQTDSAIGSANTSLKNYADNIFYLKSNPYGYINSTTLSASETDPHWSSNASLIYLKSNPYGFYNSTTLQNLSQLTDNLGSRGYTSLSNFTNNLGYLNASTLSSVETDPHWTGNYSTYLTLFNWNKTYADSLYKNLGVETWNSTFSLFNKTYADSLYAPLNYGDNWNKTYADTLYYGLNNPYGYLNSTNINAIINNSYYVPYTGSNANVVLGDYNFSVGTSDLFVDASSGKVGIGTSSPGSYSLSITGEMDYINQIGQLHLKDNDTGLSLNIGTGNYGSINFSFIQSTEAQVSNERNLILNPFGGNVGIGTTAPAAKLHLSSAATTEILLTDSDTGENVKNYGMYTDNGKFFIRRLTDAYSGYDPSITIDQGNVGIGTTIPETKLEVNGTTTFRGNHGPIYLYNNGIVGNHSFYVDSGTGNQTFGFWGSGDDDNLNVQVYDGDFMIGTSGATFFVDNALGGTGNVGIGTTNPLDKLTISGGNIQIGNSANPILKLSDTTDTQYNLYTDASTNSFGIALDGTGDRFIIDSSGNVGIGTTTPGTKLDVNGSSIIQGELLINTGDARLRLQRANGPNYLDFNSGYNLYFRSIAANDSGANTRMTIDTSGNVGIGTDVPAYALDIKPPVVGQVTGLRITGQGGVSSDNVQLRFAGQKDGELWAIGSDINGGGSTGDFEFYNLGNAGGTAGTKLTILGNGNVGIGTTSPETKLHIIASAVSTGLTIGETGSTAKQLILGYDTTSNYGGIQAVHQNNAYTNLILQKDGGNVGIGTTGPNEKLEILGGNLSLRNSNGGGDVASSSGFIKFHGASSSSSYWAGIESYRGGYPDNNDLRFYTQYGEANPVERMRIANNGNVGIGTTSPSSNLHITSIVNNVGPTLTLDLQDPGGSTNLDNVIGAIDFKHNDAQAPGVSARLVAIGEGSSGETGFGIYTGAGSATERMRIGYNGNVGIGTTTPNRPLTVVGIISSIASTSDDSNLLIQASSSGNYITSSYTSTGAYQPLSIETGGAIRMHIKTDGNVGIGTTSPGAKLDVRSDSVDSIFWGNNDASIRGQASWSGSSIRLGSATVSPVDFVINSIPKVTIATDGNVGIGTTSPLDYLHIKGANVGIRLEESQVSTADSKYWTIQNVYDSNSGTLRFRAGNDANSNGINSLVIKRSGISSITSYFENGKVGVGTTEPVVNLDILNNTGAAAFVAGTPTGHIMLGRNNVAMGLGITSGDVGWIQVANKNFASAYYDLAINPNGGNVGIGTTAPSYILDVNGTSAARFTRSGKMILINANYGGGNTNADLQTDTGMALTLSPAGGEVMRLTTGGRVGIGTTAPDSALHVRGTTGAIFDYDSASTRLDILPGDAEGVVALRYRATSGAAPALVFQNDAGTEKVRFQDNGNVGIGNATPGVRLVVNGGNSDAADTSNKIQLTNNGNVRAEFANYGGEGDLSLYRSNNVKTVFLSSYYDSYINVGKVGIGTTTPVAKLEVGDNTFGGGNGVYDDTRVGFMLNGALNSMIYASTYNDPTYPDYGMVFIHGPSTSNYNVWSISPDGPAKGDSLNFIYQPNATNIHTQTPKVVFDGNGNVGIGDTDPPSELTVTGANTGFVASNGAGINGIQLSRTTNSNENLYLYVSSGTGWSGSAYPGRIESYGNNVLEIGSQQNIPIVFGNNNAERMRIAAGGNVGIGTTGPGYKLDVNTGAASNGIRVTTSDTGSDPSIFLARNNGANDIFEMRVRGSGGAAWLNIADKTNGAFDAGLNLRGNNVGINTTNPSVKLHVVGDGANAAAFMSGNVGIGTTGPSQKLDVSSGNIALGANYVIGSGSGYGCSGCGSSGSIKLYDSSTGYTTIQSGTSYGLLLNPSGGNVGIGTTAISSTYGFEKTVSIESTNNAELQLKQTGNSNTLSMGIVNGLNYFQSTQGYGFEVGGSRKVTIQSNGNVGIGTTTPGTKLEVNGMILVNQTSSGTDFTEGIKIIRGTVPSQYTLINHLGGGTAITSVVEGGGSDGTIRFQRHNAGSGTVKVSMTIDETGEVGIGTASPAQKLEVNGTIRQSSNTSNGYSNRIFTTITTPVQNTWYETGLSMPLYMGFSAFVNAIYEDDNADGNDRSMIAHVGGYGQGGETIAYLSRPNGNEIELQVSGGKLQIRQTISNGTKIFVSVDYIMH